MKAIFISKSTGTIIDMVPYEINGGCTPMKEFYVVLSEKEFQVGDFFDIAPIQKRYPDKKSTFLDEDGKQCESIEYGKYSKDGLCVESWEVV